MKNQRGNTLIILLIIAALGLGGYYLVRNNASQTPAPTADEILDTSSMEEDVTLELDGVESEAETLTVTAENFTYSPETITVSPGETITLTNLDTARHDIMSDQEGLFQTELLDQGETATFEAPSEPGEYGYYCSIHPYMRGTIIVEEV